MVSNHMDREEAKRRFKSLSSEAQLQVLARFGHNLTIAAALGWAGTKNGALLKRASGLIDALVTIVAIHCRKFLRAAGVPVPLEPTAG
jgi:hypothetical protein